MSVPRFSVSLAAGLALIALVALGLVAALTPGPSPSAAVAGRHTGPAARPPAVSARTRVTPAGSPAASGRGVDPSTGGRDLVAAVRRDGPALGRLLDGTAQLAAAAERERRTLPALVGHAHRVAAGIRAKDTAVDEALRLLPGTLERSVTTMTALRRTLQDLDPLVTAALPATAHLAPLLRRLRGLARTAAPTVSGLRTLVRAPGRDDDLTDLLRGTPGLADRIVPALEHTASAARDARPIAASLRPAVPDALSALRGLTQASNGYDANGHAVRVDTLVPAASLLPSPTVRP